MTAFSIASGLLLAAALLFLLPPLWGGAARRNAPSQAALSIVLHRDTLRELEVERESGRIGEEEYQQARHELERRVLEDSTGTTPIVTRSSGRFAAVAVGALLPLMTIALYAGLGNPGAMDPSKRKGDDAAQSHPVSPEQVRAMAERLARRLKDAPGDAEGWVRLARSYNVLGQYANAATAYARAVSLLPGNAQVLADYADTMAMVQGRSLIGEPERIVQQALQADPGNIKALALAGTVAFERQDFDAAIRHWNRVLERVPADSDVARSISGSIADARQRRASLRSAQSSGAAVARLSGRIGIDPAVRGKVRDEDVVFIYARALEGSRMPLAIVRKQVRDLPADFVLDDSLAMQSGMRLSSHRAVLIGARVSKSGNAAPGPGDYEAKLQKVSVGTKQLDLNIASEIR